MKFDFKLLIAPIVAVVLLAFIMVAGKNKTENKMIPTATQTPQPTTLTVQGGKSPIDATYRIEGSDTTLINGESEEAIPGATTKIITSVWGEAVDTDIDGNKKDFAALVLTQDPGGSGTFYYAAAALKVNGQYFGTNAVLIGDRINIQNLEIHGDEIVVNYMDRAEGDSMSAEPVEAVSKRFKIDGINLVEVK